MFEYLKGLITAVNPAYVVLEVNGIGYLLNVSDPYHYSVDDNKIVKIYVHQVITDSYQALYGFANLKTKRLFEKLIAVSGIGPKSANAILAGNKNNSLLTAINEENITFLTKFPGVGKKTAKQLVLDLKGKLDDLLETNLLVPQSTSEAKTNQDKNVTEALSALLALGYSNRDVNKIKEKMASRSGLSVNEYLSLGLKLLTGA